MNLMKGNFEIIVMKIRSLYRTIELFSENKITSFIKST